MLKDYFDKRIIEDFDDTEEMSKQDIFDLIDEISDWCEEDDDDIGQTLTNVLWELVDGLDDSDIDRLEEIYEIINDNFIDEFEDDDWDDDVDESMMAKKKKIPRALKMKRRRLYKRNKAKIKRKIKRYRKTASFKRYSKKAKRKSVQGKTSTGKRKSKFI